MTYFELLNDRGDWTPRLLDKRPATVIVEGVERIAPCNGTSQPIRGIVTIPPAAAFLPFADLQATYSPDRGVAA